MRFIRLKTLAKILLDYTEKIGLSKVQLPMKNSTPHARYQKFYDEESKNLVAKRFERDIDFSNILSKENLLTRR